MLLYLYILLGRHIDISVFINIVDSVGLFMFVVRPGQLKIPYKRLHKDTCILVLPFYLFKYLMIENLSFNDLYEH